MTKIFSAEDIDAIMMDIEGLKLPAASNFPVLQLLLGTVGDFLDESSPLRVGIDWARPDVPAFIKAQSMREGSAYKPKPEDVTEAIRGTLAEGQPKTAVAPQAAFSPAPLPEALRAAAEPQPTPAADPQPAPAPEAIEPKTGPWSQTDEDHLLAQRANGVPFKEIAIQLNRPLAATNAKHSNLLRAAASPKKTSNRWTDEEENILLSGHLQAVPMQNIANDIGKQRAACDSKLHYIKQNQPEKLEAARAALKAKGIEPIATQPAAASKHVGKAKAAPALASKSEGGKGILPRPCPDDNWPIEDDLDLVSEHHRGLSMIDVSIMLERTKPDCVARYMALVDAMPAGPHTERQIKLKQTLTHHATLARAA